MKNHPEYGLEILVETQWKNSLVHEVVYAHHERMDGSGYPRGLVGKAAHEAARITAICDAFDAMTTDRPYQRARKGLQALRILRFDEKDRYDQQLTELFIRVLANPG
jgi:HD-GYP domain-containing protein (c-di-GMP phosphodiesterase class II)